MADAGHDGLSADGQSGYFGAVPPAARLHGSRGHALRPHGSSAHPLRRVRAVRAIGGGAGAGNGARRPHPDGAPRPDVRPRFRRGDREACTVDLRPRPRSSTAARAGHHVELGFPSGGAGRRPVDRRCVHRVRARRRSVLRERTVLPPRPRRGPSRPGREGAGPVERIERRGQRRCCSRSARGERPVTPHARRASAPQGEPDGA